MRESTKAWLKAAVVTFAVVDGVGIYVAQQRLSQPVPADMGNDLAYALPADTGVFRPDQGMPSLNRAAGATPAKAQLAAARPAAAPVQLAAAVPAPAAQAPAVHAPTDFAKTAAPRVAAPAPHFAVVAPEIAPVHRSAASAPTPGRVRLAQLGAPLHRAAPLHRTDVHGSAAPLAGLVAPRTHARLFADAFGNDFANVPLDAPITQQLDDAPAQSAFAADGTVPDTQLAHNGGVAPAGHDAGTDASSAAALPEAGPAAILPDSDVL